MAGSSAHDHGQAGSVWYATVTMAAENTGRRLSILLSAGDSPFHN